MKSMFRSFLGLHRLALIFILATFASSMGHAIFIRGNGGFAIFENGQWYAHDTYEWLTTELTLVPHYSKEPFVHGKVYEYIFNLPSPLGSLQAFGILNSLELKDCTLADFQQPDTDYTFLATMTDLERDLKKRNPTSSFELAAINFYNTITDSYRVCKTPFFDRLPEDQRAIIVLHEVVYIYLEVLGQKQPTPMDVRKVVIQTLKSVQ